MISKTLKIKNPTGLHTRPANNFITLANSFESDITISKGDKTANAKSIIKLLRIGISQGDTVTLQAEGSDEEEAIASLESFINNLEE